MSTSKTRSHTHGSTEAHERDAKQVEIEDAIREQRRQMALRHVRQYPDPVLRRKASDVEVFDEELVALVERMHSIMRDAQGVGLAGPQLGLLQRLFTYRFTEDGEMGVIINPVVESAGSEREIEEEGCLSLLGGDLRVEVERSTTARITGKDVTGAAVEFDLDGFEARVFQHEIDHLDGILTIDKPATDASRKASMTRLRPAT